MVTGEEEAYEPLNDIDDLSFTPIPDADEYSGLSPRPTRGNPFGLSDEFIRSRLEEMGYEYADPNQEYYDPEYDYGGSNWDYGELPEQFEVNEYGLPNEIPEEYLQYDPETGEYLDYDSLLASAGYEYGGENWDYGELPEPAMREIPDEAAPREWPAVLTYLAGTTVALAAAFFVFRRGCAKIN